MKRPLRLKPDSPEFHFNLANASLKLGRVDDAIKHYQRASELKPDFAEAQNGLGADAC